MNKNPLDTPLMKQYAELKARHPDALLLFRLGDFYELFGNDAVLGSRLLEITLTSRDSIIPMAGVPVRHYRNYLKILVEAGYRVAIAEQMEEPKGGKTLVRREVVEVITPGAELMDALEAPSAARRLAGIWKEGTDVGIASVDVSLGEIRVDLVQERDMVSVLARISAAEVVCLGQEKALVESWLNNSGSRAMASVRALDQFNEEALKKLPFSCPNLPKNTRRALAGIIIYIEEMIPDAIKGLERVVMGREYQVCELDARSLRTLDILCAANGDMAAPNLRKGLDRTATAPGSRLLREWLVAPARDLGIIRERHDMVEVLLKDPQGMAALHQGLGQVRDLERMAVRMKTGRITPREMGALATSLEALGSLAVQVQSFPGRLGSLGQAWSGLEKMVQQIKETLVERPPITLGEAPTVRPNVAKELDIAREKTLGAEERINQLQMDERQKTGISNLKIGYSRGVGYFIEVSKANLAKVPDNYRQKQTMTNAVRYTTDTMVAEEKAIESAGFEEKKWEAILFDRLKGDCLSFVPAVRAAAKSVAEIDCISAFAITASEYGYTRPEILEKPGIQIWELRHPLVERVVAGGTFIPNDVIFQDGEHLMLLTGPNMGGKSTVLKSVAVAQIMAQSGSFVAAGLARISLMDKIMSRIGAGDDLARGLSTFMVEMQETARILEVATPESLVVLDELGRGPSTADGVAVAWAVTEELARRKCHTLFATHFHELIDLAEKIPEAVNASMEVAEVLDELVFLHKIQPGGSDRSYGLHVAELAGVPKRVVDRAKAIQSTQEYGQGGGESGAAHVMPSVVEGTVVQEILDLSLVETTPLDALIWLTDCQNRLREKKGQD